MERTTRGTVQMGIVLDDLPYLRVYAPSQRFQEEITILVQQAYESIRESRLLYRQAEQLLLDELGLQDLELSDELYGEATLTESWRAGRLDAEHFQPKYHRVLDAIHQSGYVVESLGELIEPIRNGFDFREYGEEGTPYLRVGDIRNGRIYLENAVKIPITRTEIKKNVGLQVGDILFTRKGTFGHAAVVREGQEDAIISSEIMLLRKHKNSNLPILPDYFALFLNSDLGYQQVERKVHGMAYYSISQPDLAQVEIVIPSTKIQEEISTRVQYSLAKEQEAKHLLEQAKRKVEAMIESEAVNG